MDGHNVLDFVDPDIDRKLEELEREEAPDSELRSDSLRELSLVLGTAASGSSALGRPGTPHGTEQPE